ncbi:MAG TPA: hypothetical protein VFT61_04400 [Sphingomicrobium sp.]|nr:hypothetical protein [Sphingomicrobium sp.]
MTDPATKVMQRADQAITRANAIFERLDQRDGAARDAARRERQRLNAEFVHRVGRVGVAIGLISILTIIIGLITPIGMFGFLAAVGLAIGIAALLLFIPGGSAAKAPSADLPNAQMVQRFDSYLYRTRALLPLPARAEIDRISAVLASLKQTLQRTDPFDPDAQDARRLMSIHLPGLIDRYQHVPSAFRGEQDSEGMTVDERLVESLGAARAALDEISEKLARADVAAFETQGRFIKSRYSEDGPQPVAPTDDQPPA